MKKSIIVLIILITILSFVGCNAEKQKSQENDEFPESQEDKNTELDIRVTSNIKKLELHKYSTPGLHMRVVMIDEHAEPIYEGFNFSVIATEGSISTLEKGKSGGQKRIKYGSEYMATNCKYVAFYWNPFNPDGSIVSEDVEEIQLDIKVFDNNELLLSTKEVIITRVDENQYNLELE